MRHPLGLNDITVIPPPTQTPERAHEIYHPAFLRVMEYVHYGNIPGDILEFGTFHGYTARTLAEHMRTLGSKKNLHLYDSWEGFPAMTGNDAECPEVKANIWQQGSCNPMIENADQAIKFFLEMVIPGRIHTHKGFYEKTVPSELPGKAAVVHIDCDLYESTYHVLKNLIKTGHLSQGSIILFDDWNNNAASNEYGERKAVCDLFPIGSTMGGFFRQQKTTLSAMVEPLMRLEPWFTYGSSGYAFIVHKRAS